MHHIHSVHNWARGECNFRYLIQNSHYTCIVMNWHAIHNYNEANTVILYASSQSIPAVVY